MTTFSNPLKTPLDTPAAKPAAPRKRHSVRRRRQTILLSVALAGVVGFGAFGYLAAGRGYKTAILKSLGLHRPAPPPVKVAATTPDNGAVDVALSPAISIDLRMPQGDHIEVDSLSDVNAVRLVRAGDQVPVPVELRRVGRGKVEVRPLEALQPLTNYNLFVNSDLKTDAGASAQGYLTGFTTAGTPDPDIAFEKVALPTTAGRGVTSLTFGPDGKLYAGTDEGVILRYEVYPDGTLSAPQEIAALTQHAGGPRLLIGLVFDPKSTADNLVAWVTHNFCAFEEVPDFTGAVSRLSGPNLETVEDVITGLPRSIRDHATNQPAFGPDGALYIPQASNTAYGAPDAFWGMRPERLLNASVLRLDTSRVTPGKPIDVKTADAGGTYDPAAPGAPLTIYATGVRLAYELIWHSNGHLYAPTNGSSLGGNAPAGDGAPYLKNIPLAEDDWLHRVAQGAYHGHPNPAQGHFVLNGGNPTDDFDFAELPVYPVGTKPDPKWVRPAYVLGQHISANGVIEYRSNAANGKLKGRMLICRYSRGRDLVAVAVNAAGDVVDVKSAMTGLSDFENPLDVVEHPDKGFLYVSEYGARRVTLCRPVR